MPAPPFHDTSTIVIAATLWLMHRHRQTGCKKLARMVEQHLRWLRISATNPQLADACEHLSFEWRSASATTSAAIPSQPALH